MGFSGGSDGKASACNVGDLGSILRLERSPGEENGNPLQYSCMENSMDRGAWQAIVHGVAKSQTRLSNFTSSQHFSFPSDDSVQLEVKTTEQGRSTQSDRPPEYGAGTVSGQRASWSLAHPSQTCYSQGN